MALNRCHYLEQGPLGAQLGDFTKRALCGRAWWSAVSPKREDIDCKACLKRLAARDRAEARAKAERERHADFARTNTASYALGQMLRQHGRAWA